MEQKENSQNFDEAKIDAEKEQTFLSRCPECESIKSLDINLLGKKIINESANDKTANTTSPADTAENNGNNSPENIYAKVINYFSVLKIRKNACNNKNKRESIILLFVLIFVLIACTSILYYLAPYIYLDKAAEAYNKGEYTQAVKWYRKAAEQGYAKAQNNLGVCYANGYGVNKDYSEAVKWYRKAAEQGHEKARKNLENLAN